MARNNHAVDQSVIATLDRSKNRIAYALEEYKRAEKPLSAVEFNIRQTIHALKELRKELIHSADY